MEEQLSYSQLKQKHRTLREGFSDSLSLRVHRALSWLQRAELAHQQDPEDLDAQFIFLWISFNAAYSQEVDISRLTESQSFQYFVDKLCELDEAKTIYQLIWDQFPTSIRLLIDNQFVFQPFWDYQNGKITETEWKERFSAAKSKANKALSQEDSPTVLTVILSRLYTLRNQLIHGGATWHSSTNREQLRDAVRFLSKLVPRLIDLMMDNPHTLWGDANYPVVIC